MKATVRHDDFMHERLADAQFAAGYLQSALEDGDSGVLLLALRRIAEARGGMAKLAQATGLSREALNKLFERGIMVRNQSVFQRGVNDKADTMIELGRRLGSINVHPYYVYIHDLVKGTEDLRTSVASAIQAEKRLRIC